MLEGKKKRIKKNKKESNEWVFIDGGGQQEAM